MVAEVVIPLTRLSHLKITPAPRKPIPVTILEAMRSGLTSLMNLEKVVKRKEPRQIRIMVLKPADLLRYSLSAPIIPPTAITISNLNINSSREGIAQMFGNEVKDRIHVNGLIIVFHPLNFIMKTTVSLLSLALVAGFCSCNRSQPRYLDLNTNEYITIKK